MHILLIHQAFVRSGEAGGTRHYEFARRLALDGHESTVVTGRLSYLSGEAGTSGDSVPPGLLRGTRAGEVRFEFVVTYAGAMGPANDLATLISAAAKVESEAPAIHFLLVGDGKETTYPNKVFDYMAAGRPLVLAIDGVIREVVSRAGCGVFSQPGDPADLARSILQLHNQPQLRETMGRSGQSHVAEHFNRKTQVLDFLKMAEGLVAGHD